MMDTCDNLLFESPGRGVRVQVTQSALIVMSRLSLSSNVETGGILVGRYTDDETTATITEAWPPPSDSRSGPASFKRGKAGLQEALISAWDRSERVHYLGEWHFHTANIPVPSRQDLDQMTSIAGNHAYRCPTPLLVITTPQGPAQVGFNVFLFRGVDVEKLRPVRRTD